MADIKISSLNEDTLILNGVITFQENDKQHLISVQTPSIGDLADDPDLIRFLNILSLEVEDINELENLPFEFKTKGDMLIGFMAFPDIFEDFSILKHYFKKYVKNVVFKDNFMYVIDKIGEKEKEIEVSAAEIQYIANIILVASGRLLLEDVDLEKLQKAREERDRIANMSEREKRHYETQQRLAAAKARKQNRDASEQEPLTIAKIIAGVMREFNMSITEIRNLNYFGLYYFFGYVYKIDNYEITKKLYANGHLKEGATLKHWLN